MESMNISGRALFSGVCAAVLLAGAAVSVQAQDSNKMPTAREAAGGVSYLNGGVTVDEADQMRGLAKDWPLRVSFAQTGTGAFIADVNLVVADKDGKTRFELNPAGPMTFIKLPPGQYRVTADFKGRKETRDVTLGAGGGQTVDFRWAGDKQ